MEFLPETTTYFDYFGDNSTDSDYFGENTTFEIYAIKEKSGDCYIDFNDMRVPNSVQVVLIFLNLFATLVSLAVLIVFGCVWKTLKTSDLIMCAMTACSFLITMIFFIHFIVARAFGMSEAPDTYCSLICYGYSLFSIFVLLLTCCMAVVCLLAVARPSSHGRVQRRGTGIKLILLLFFVAMLFAFPVFLFREPQDDPFLSPACSSHTDVAHSYHDLAMLKLHVSTMLYTCCLLCMFVCYVYIWRRMWRGSIKVGRKKLSPSARHALMLTVLVLLFMLLTYGPNYMLHLLQIAVHHGAIHMSCVWVVDLFLAARYVKVLLQCHAVCNPFLYAFLSSSFRSQAKEAKMRLSALLQRVSGLY